MDNFEHDVLTLQSDIKNWLTNKIQLHHELRDELKMCISLGFEKLPKLEDSFVLLLNTQKVPNNEENKTISYKMIFGHYLEYVGHFNEVTQMMDESGNISQSSLEVQDSFAHDVAHKAIIKIFEELANLKGVIANWTAVDVGFLDGDFFCIKFEYDRDRTELPRVVSFYPGWITMDDQRLGLKMYDRIQSNGISNLTVTCKKIVF